MADKDTEEKIVPVGPGADDDTQGDVAQTDERAGDDYAYPDTEDGNADQDERVGRSEERDDGEDSRDAGLTRQQRKRRHQRETRERDRRELEFLRSRNEQLERQRSQELARIENRQTQSEILSIDGRISQLEGDVREAEALYAQARKNNDGDSEIEALRVRDQLREGLQQAKAAKQQTVRASQERQAAANRPQAVDPLIASRAEAWMRERTWFDPQLRNEDSLVAHAVEQAVARDGRFDPRTEEYWREVDRRAARRLPERYQDRRTREPDEDEDDDDVEDTPQRRVPRKPSGPVIKIGGRERTLRKGEVYVDEDRKQAMIEKGVWDDPVLRERQLKYYQKYDREAGRRSR